MMRTGPLFMFGIYGTRATRESIALLKATHASGVLLLARNIESPTQVRRLTQELQERLGRHLLFAVDHEGGWVLRFTKGVTGFPGNAALGKIGNPDLAYAQGHHMALELSSMGIHLNLAPVLDVLTDKYNPGIGIRSFGKNPELVSRLGSSFIKGLQDHGVSACAKHFPGKGAATQDAHVTLPSIKIPLPEFKKIHLAPFEAAIAAGVRCVMTSHVVFSALDPFKTPATFSRKITEKILRRQLGFDGIVISDDLCMGAVTERWPIQEAAVNAIESGHDFLIIAHEPRIQREAAELLETAVTEHHVSREIIERSARRIRALMAHHRKPPTAPPNMQEGTALAQKIAAGATEIVQAGHVALPLDFTSHDTRSVAVLWPDFREVKDRFTFEDGIDGTERRLKSALASWPTKTILLKTPVQQTGAKAQTVVDKASTCALAIYFCFEAMRFPGQKETLGKLQAAMPERLVVCLIRNSWDRELIQPGVTILDAHSYRAASIDALLRTFSS